MLAFVGLKSISFVASPKLIAGVASKFMPNFLMKNHPKHFVSKNSYCSPVARNGVVSDSQEKIVDDEEDVDEKYAKVGLKRGECVIPKHVAICLDGNRKWLKLHGLDLDYAPFFRAHMRFAECCVKWGIGTGTSYVYGLGNVKHRTKEASDLLYRQFESFLKEGLENFIRQGVKVSVVGEKWILPESCQAIANQVEEATKFNSKLNWMLATCYTSQRDMVHATRKICKLVKEVSVELEDVNEDLIQQHFTLGGGTQPPIDLYIRTGGQLRIGMLLGWQVPHVELYFNDTCAPEFGEDVFVEALRSFQQRTRQFAK